MEQPAHTRRDGSVRKRAGHEEAFRCHEAGGDASAMAEEQHRAPEVHSVSSPWHVHRVFSAFNLEKSMLVKSIGFGGLLMMPNIRKLDKSFSLWLMGRLDTGSDRLVLHAGNGNDLVISDVDVHLVLGIPYKGLEVVDDGADTPPILAKKIKPLLLMDNPKDSLTMGYLEHLLTMDYSGGMNKREEDAFRIAVVLYSFGVFLGTPLSDPKVPLGITRNLVQPKSIGSFNWCGYVLKCISEAAKHAQQQISAHCVPVMLSGCTFLLQVIYLDNMDFGPLNRAHTVMPRAADFSSEYLSKLIEADKGNQLPLQSHCYGRSKPRPIEIVCYSRGRRMKAASTTNQDKEPHASDSPHQVLLNKVLKLIQDYNANVSNAIAALIEEHQHTLMESITVLINTHHQNTTTSNTAELNQLNQQCAGVYNFVRARKKTVARRSKSYFWLVEKTPLQNGVESAEMGPFEHQSVGSNDNTPCSYGTNSPSPNNNSCISYIPEFQLDSISEAHYPLLVPNNLNLSEVPGSTCQNEYFDALPIDVIYPEVDGNQEIEDLLDHSFLEHEPQNGTMLLEGNMSQETPTNDTCNGDTIRIEHMEKLAFSGLRPVISQNIDIRQLFAYFGVDPAHHVGSAIQEVSTTDSMITMQSREDMDVDNGFPTSSSNPPAQLEWSSSSDVEVVDVESDETSEDGDEEVNVKIVHSHSNFGPHPDDLGLYHDQPLTKKAKEIFEAYSRGYVRLNRDHIVHNVPTRLSIDGVNLCWQMMLGGSFGVTLCDLIMRLYKSLDDRMYEPGQTRWRHFLPASFAAKVLNGENYIEDADVRAAFIGNHISYNVEDCSMIIVPVLSTGRWSCYFWDFVERRIHVLDPTMMRSTIVSVRLRHYSLVTRINAAISMCKDIFFQGWGVDMTSFTKSFLVGLGGSCQKNNSGLFATHYARAYDGNSLLWGMKTSEHAVNRAELLYQLLAMDGNCGDIPSLMIDLLEI